jgi:hypothetical protein
MKWACCGILALLVLAPGSAAAAGCQLSPKDFESLAVSPSKIQNQAQVDALEASRQDKLCVTRGNFAKYHAQGGGLQSSQDIYALYLSPQETEEYSVWLDAYMNKLLKQPGAAKAMDDLREQARKEKANK